MFCLSPTSALYVASCISSIIIHSEIHDINNTIHMNCRLRLAFAPSSDPASTGHFILFFLHGITLPLPG